MALVSVRQLLLLLLLIVLSVPASVRKIEKTIRQFSSKESVLILHTKWQASSEFGLYDCTVHEDFACLTRSFWSPSDLYITYAMMYGYF